jgi:hypothetical protein
MKIVGYLLTSLLTTIALGYSAIANQTSSSGDVPFAYCKFINDEGRLVRIPLGTRENSIGINIDSKNSLLISLEFPKNMGVKLRNRFG